MAFNLSNLFQGAANKVSSLVSPAALGRMGETIKGGLSGKAKAVIGLGTAAAALGNPLKANADTLQSSAMQLLSWVASRNPAGAVLSGLANAEKAGDNPENIGKSPLEIAEAKAKSSPQPSIGKQYGPPAPVAVSPAALENIIQSTVRKPTASVPQVTKPSIARTTPPASAPVSRTSGPSPIQSAAQGTTAISPEVLMRQIPSAPQTQIPSVTSPIPAVKSPASLPAAISEAIPESPVKSPSIAQMPAASPITGFTPSPSPSMGALVSLPAILKVLAQRGDVMPPAGNVAMPENMPLNAAPIRRKKAAFNY